MVAYMPRTLGMRSCIMLGLPTQELNVGTVCRLNPPPIRRGIDPQIYACTGAQLYYIQY